MVVKTLTEDKLYYYSKSDNNKYIKQVSTGNIYADVYDLIEYPQEYEETDIDIEKIEEE